MSKNKLTIRLMGCLLLSVLVAGQAFVLHSAAALDCASSTAPTMAGGQKVVADAYAAWKVSFVVPAVDGQLRVQRSAGDSNDTVSEGIAYGMLFAAYNNDQATFDGLWQYAQAHTNNRGFMNWRIAADGTTTGYNGATDADEDMAAALIAADTQWGGYKQDAQTLINLIKKYEIEAGTTIVKPGDYWGGSDIVNPSYLAPSYYEAFSQYMNDPSWKAVQATSYKVLNSIHNRTPAGKTGLVPDWSDAIGNPVANMGYDYSYDASRAPIRLALASGWTCDANANNLLAPFNTTHQKLALKELASSYSLGGSAGNKGDNAPMIAAAAAAATSSNNQTYRDSSWQTLVNTKATSYFPDSMRLLGLMTASGVFVNPLELKTAAAVIQKPAAAPTAAEPTVAKTVEIWWPTATEPVFGEQPFKALLQNSDVDDYTMYWQVDGGKKNIMDNDLTEYPHKLSNVNLRGWNWHGNGPYKLTFTAVDATGAVLGSSSTTMTIDH